MMDSSWRTLQADDLLQVALVEEPSTAGNLDKRCRGLNALVCVLKRMKEVINYGLLNSTCVCRGGRRWRLKSIARKILELMNNADGSGLAIWGMALGQV